MKLMQCRIVSDRVGPLAAFYAELVGVAVTLNEYYVEVPAGAVSVGFSRQRFTNAARPARQAPARPESFSTSWLTTWYAEHERIF